MKISVSPPAPAPGLSSAAAYDGVPACMLDQTTTPSQALRDLAQAPGDRKVRQAATERDLDVARRTHTQDTARTPPTAAVGVAIRMVADDLMVFAGVDADEAYEAVRGAAGSPRVQPPAREPQPPLSPARWSRDR